MNNEKRDSYLTRRNFSLVDGSEKNYLCCKLIDASEKNYLCRKLIDASEKNYLCRRLKSL